jgi:hypothetical protein
MAFLKNNKYKIGSLFFLIIFFIFTLLISQVFSSLKFFVLIPMSITLGLAYTVFFRDTIPVKNILTFLVLSLFFGLFFNSLIIFVLGMLGIIINIGFFTIYIPIALLINLVVFWFFVKEEKLKEYFKNFKPDLVDIIWLIIFTVFLFLFIKICMEQFFPNWDNFTYWAIDAKYIFETGLLDGKSSLDLISKFYLPFYPLQLAYVYFLYGTIVEQFSSLITLTYGFIGAFLLGSYLLNLKNKGFLKSILYFFILSGLLFLFFSLNTLVTQYADVFCSILVLFLGITLFSKKPKRTNFVKRLSLVFIFLMALYLTKLAYAPITFLLLFLYLYYDFHFFKNLLKDFLKEKRKILFLIIMVLGIVAIFGYLGRNFGFFNQVDRYAKLLLNIQFFTQERFLYSVKVFKYLLRRLPEIFLLTTFLFGGYILTNRGVKKVDVRKFLLVLVLFLFPVGFYLIILKDLGNGSLLRYVSLTFFLIPFLFINVLEDFKSKGKGVLTAVFLIVWTAFVFLNISLEYSLRVGFSPHSGNYRESQLLGDHYLFGSRILEIIPSESSIMIVGEEYEDFLGNINKPVLYIRYYLAMNSVGGQYRVPKEDWFGHMEKFHPDYILVLEYNDYWEECNHLLLVDENYLIKTDEIKDYEVGCFFESKDVFLIE